MQPALLKYSSQEEDLILDSEAQSTFVQYLQNTAGPPTEA